MFFKKKNQEIEFPTAQLSIEQQIDQLREEVWAIANYLNVYLSKEPSKTVAVSRDKTGLGVATCCASSKK